MQKKSPVDRRVKGRAAAPSNLAPPRAALWPLTLLVVLGAQTMIVELVLPRMIAPVFGNTLFSWTAIIAVVLTALALGYELGGRLSRQARSTRWIPRLALLASAWIGALALLGPDIVQRLDWAGLMLGPLLACALLAAAPAAIAAAVVPLAVQALGEASGSASGRCFAWSTIGSIAGVIGTGYLLLPWLGIGGSLLVGPALVAAVLLLGGYWRHAALGGVLLALALPTTLTTAADGLLVDRSNGYHRIRVSETAGGLRYLRLDSTLEGAVMGASPVPVLEYQRGIETVLGALDPPSDVLFLGGGSFSMPRYVKHLHPGARVSAIEIDRDVIAVAREYLYLDGGIGVVEGDARQVVAADRGRYDLIVNDAFHGVRQIPFHLVTREFHALVAERLAPGGVYAVNVIGHPRDSRLVASILRTLALTFPRLRLLYDDRGQATNIWILASRAPLAIGEPASPDDGSGMLFSDDHAPVEYLIAGDLLGF